MLKKIIQEIQLSAKLPDGVVATIRAICEEARNSCLLNATDISKKSAGGLWVLFCGHSGTGKTLASKWIAQELGRELLHVDLSAVVSKYIGETEKDLEALFDGAQSSGGILFFDEADALFGKRSEVKDSHDRYANLEVNGLLQRIEEFNGIAILTTNKCENIDPAFLRRLRYVVDLP